jgi:2-polyprenyl-3-methyl-5-hydroxy-6-metoxy-1,4-benzoquinol methylase
MQRAINGDYAVRFKPTSLQLLDILLTSLNLMLSALEEIQKAKTSAFQKQPAAKRREYRFKIETAQSILKHLSLFLLEGEIGSIQRTSMEKRYREVYGYCPPTVTTTKTEEDRVSYRAQWAGVMESVGLTPEMFKDARLLDAGCGSCEKAIFYHEYGAKVTGIDMTPAPLEIGRKAIGERPIKVLNTSIFDLDKAEGPFDIIISDGVLHCAHNTRIAYEALLPHLAPAGHILISIINVWGSLWWFEYARLMTKIIGGEADFHSRAQVGIRLFSHLRDTQEGTEETSSYSRSVNSWAYDWFAAPNWNLHRPQEVLRWMADNGLEFIAASPSVEPAAFSKVAEIFDMDCWNEEMHLFWLAAMSWNTMFFHGQRGRGVNAIHS